MNRRMEAMRHINEVLEDMQDQTPLTDGWTSYRFVEMPYYPDEDDWYKYDQMMDDLWADEQRQNLEDAYADMCEREWLDKMRDQYWHLWDE